MHLPEQGQQEVSVEVALVHLIHDDDIVCSQQWVGGHEAQQDTLRHEHHLAATWQAGMSSVECSEQERPKMK
eukprot:1156318-Pelagomonas_calceolata.AAC.14